MSLAVKVARAGSQGGIGAGRRVSSGDPGVFGFLKGLGKTALSFATGGPQAALGTAFSQVRGGRPTAPSMPVLPVPGVRAAAQRFFPGGATGLETRGEAVGTKLACPSGYRPNKSDYFLKDGTYVEAGTRCVKNRRRNPMNPRALSRAIARIDGGKRLQNTLGEITTAKYTAGGKHKAHH